MANERIRTTISLDPEVHAIFVSMAEAAGTSVSRCMGDWLADTSEGAQFVAAKMLEARRAPKTVMREMQALSRGLVDELDEQVRSLRFSSSTGPAGGVGEASPCSPTGINTPSGSKNGGKKP